MKPKKSSSYPVTPAFWRRLDRVLEKHRKKVEADTRRILDEVIGEEARAYMLNHFREHPYS